MHNDNMEGFNIWWEYEGSKIIDSREVKNLCKVAWANGSDKIKEKIINRLEEI